MADTSPPRAVSDEGGSAVGMLMALVPCTVSVAHHILDNAARAVGVSRVLAAQTVMGLRHQNAGAGAGDDQARGAVRAEIVRARTAAQTPPASPTVFPSAFVLRQHVNHLRAARRRTLAPPDDAVQRAELENCLYTLCVLTGLRSAPAALAATEAYLAANRLQPSDSAADTGNPRGGHRK
ncbi:DUF5133 domain-containing protein [Streptomyces roseus]|uniref:DUF5133 domain-containing protein n=1 Tax=Streptomyces roseus TaxID=66430 RepID=UPI0033DF6B10